MSKQEQTNTFQDGIMTDMHPLSANNTTMTDAKNATIVTYNGNEMILQNDMGNARLLEYQIGDTKKYVSLTEGFKPLGVKEHGGILYIASYKPGENPQFELGSFPGPDYSDDKNILVADIKDKGRTLDYKRSIIFPKSSEGVKDLKTETLLYQNIPLTIKIDDKVKSCNLKVGLEFLIDVLNHVNLTDKERRKFYKVKFINLENNQDITDLLNFAVTHKDLYRNYSESDTFQYFPNIKNITLGVRFELEDIDTFKLGQLPLDLYKDYNGSRYPYLNEELWRVEFPFFEYKTSSDIQVNQFIIEWRLTSKTSLNSNIDKSLLEGVIGPIKLDINNDSDIYKIELNDLNTIKLPNNNKFYYLDYVIYPEWDDLSNNITDTKVFTKDHPNYQYTLDKWVIRNSIDLSISPTEWGSQELYIDESKFKDNRYLSKDLQFEEGGSNKFKIGLSVKNYLYNYYNFLRHYKNIGDYPINDSKDRNSIEYKGCLNLESLDFSKVFPNIKEELYNWVRIVGDDWNYWDSPLRLYKVEEYRDYFSPNIMINRIYTKKPCKIHSFFHYNLQKNKNFKNLNFYNITKGKIYKEGLLNLWAEKHSPFCIYGHTRPVFSNMSHIKTNEIALSPLCLLLFLTIYNESYEYDENGKNSWKKLSCPISGCPDTLNGIHEDSNVTSWFGYDGKYNTNSTDNITKEIAETSKELLSLNKDSYEIKLHDGSLNVLILTNFLCLVGKQGVNDEGKYKDEWLEDINLDINLVSSLFLNSIIADNFNVFDIVDDTVGSNKRITWDDIKVDGERTKDRGCFVKWKYEYDFYDSYIEIDNNLEQTILLALSKIRIKDDLTLYIDNHNNYVYSVESQGILYPTHQELNNSSYFILNNIQQSECNSSKSVIAPYHIHLDGTSYNYIELSKTTNPEYKYTFENTTKNNIYNIRFYLKQSIQNKSYVDLEIEGLKNYKIYILDNNSDISLLESNKFNYVNDNFKFNYKLVQIIGVCSEDEISLTFKSSGNESTFYHIIRNLNMFELTSLEPLKTYAISTYYDTKTLIDCSEFINNKDYNITAGGKDYCFLPEPSYFIDSKKPNFTCSNNGTTKINGKTFDIITS